MAYAIARTATKNTEINGRTLYLTNIGLWSLDPNHAKLFKSEPSAKEIDSMAFNPGEIRVVEITF